MRGLGGRGKKGLAVIAAVGVLLAVIVAGGATATQGQPAAGQEGKVQPLSVNCRASFSAGAGPNLLNICVSDHGNLIDFVSPAGSEHMVQEGYTVCTGIEDDVPSGHDTGTVEGGFGPATITQPTAGKFPLTVVRRTTDGVFELKQVWAKPDNVEKDITVTMTLKKLTAGSIADVFLIRRGDVDAGSTGSDHAARTADSALLWDDGGHGLLVEALTFGTSHATRIESFASWSDLRDECASGGVLTPAPPADYAFYMYYNLGTMSANQSKTVKVRFARV